VINLKLAPRRKKYVVERRQAKLVGGRLTYNISQQLRYERALKKMLAVLTQETLHAITHFFNSATAKKYYNEQEKIVALDANLGNDAKKLTDTLRAKFNKIFGRTNKKLAKDMVDDSLKSSETRLKSSLKTLSGGLTLNTDILTGGLKDIVVASVNQNVELITSIQDQYLTSVSTALMRSITDANNGGLGPLIEELKKLDGISDRRAENIALDQTRKVYNSINAGRLKALGVKKFKWLHSFGGQKPRESHLKILNGKIFSFENLIAEQIALGVPEQDRGLPSVPINCRCTLTPVIEFDEGEPD
jgi:SPP1 gp7 family putative phage head morphogenesis protein